MKELSESPPAAARHPIAVVSERTGLTQDVLRIWERRYGAVRPQRAAGGRRLYTDADIERLGLLNAAMRAGRSIGQVAPLSTDALLALVGEDAEARARSVRSMVGKSDSAALVETALALTRSLDGPELNERLRRGAAFVGLPAFVESVAAPLLRRVGDEWHAGRLSPAQEHLVSSVLHDIMVETMRAFPRRNGAPGVLVATPAGERHTIGAALVGAAAAVAGWNVLYLGADLPAKDIAEAAGAAGVRVVAVSLVYVDDRERILRELRTLRSRLAPGITLVAGGAGASALAAELSGMGLRVESGVPGWLAELQANRGEGGG